MHYITKVDNVHVVGTTAGNVSIKEDGDQFLFERCQINKNNLMILPRFHQEVHLATLVYQVEIARFLAQHLGFIGEQNNA